MLNLFKTLFSIIISIFSVKKKSIYLPSYDELDDINDDHVLPGEEASLISDDDQHQIPPIESIENRFKIDEAGWLVGDKVFKAEKYPRSDAKSKLMVNGKPLGVVTHATATDHGSADVIWKAWQSHNGPEDNHSAHLTIESDGTVYQSIPFLRSAWHAGGSIKMADGGRKRSNAFINGVTPNSSTIGIEITNLGEVKKKKDSKLRGWSSKGGVGTGTAVNESETIKIKDKIYHAYTKEQIDTWREIVLALLEAYPSLSLDDVEIQHSPETLRRLKSLKKTRKIKRIHITHNDLDPLRKWDPGPAWEFPEL